MYEAFDKLPEDKKGRILNICLDEFAENGYENTSTDTITSRAGISKGILFHYFKSKKNLYLYLLEHTRKQMTDHILTAMEKETLEDRDFFERIKAITLLKFREGLKYERETKLWLRAVSHPPDSLKRDIEGLIAKQWAHYQQREMQEMIYLRGAIDPNKLRDGVTPDHVIRVSRMLLEQVSKEYQQRAGQQGSLTELQHALTGEIDLFFDVLQHGIYK